MRRVLVYILQLSILFVPCSTTAQQAAENELKAAFLSRFLNFVEGVSVAQNSIPQICVLGESPVASALKHLSVLEKERIEYQFRKLDESSQAQSCAVLFIASSKQEELSQILSRLDTTPTLTVSDISNFAERGGMVELFKDNEHIRFNINRTAVEKAGIKLSAQLLSLAKRLV